MSTFLYIALILLLVIFITFLLFFWTFQIYYGTAKNRIVYLPTVSGKVLKHIQDYLQKNIDNPSQYHLIELGCGLANVSSFLAGKFKFKKIVGVEVDWMTYFMVKTFFLFKKTQIEFIRKDVLDYKIPEKSIVYAYLTSEIMTNLKKQKSLENCLVFSLTFPIENTKATQEIDLKNFYKKLYIYDFRKTQE